MVFLFTVRYIPMVTLQHVNQLISGGAQREVVLKCVRQDYTVVMSAHECVTQKIEITSWPPVPKSVARSYLVVTTARVSAISARKV